MLLFGIGWVVVALLSFLVFIFLGCAWEDITIGDIIFYSIISLLFSPFALFVALIVAGIEFFINSDHKNLQKIIIRKRR